MKSSAIYPGGARFHTGRHANTIARIALSASLALSVASQSAQAHEPTIQDDGVEQITAVDTDTLSLWLKARFNEAELARLLPEDLSIEPHYCSCSDRPTRHFPYPIVLLKTPKRDLLARPELREFSVGFTALAVRFGNRYCAVESESECYGSFADACDFTDFRYGPSLAAFFPTCKSDEDEAASSLPPGELPVAAELPHR